MALNSPEYFFDLYLIIIRRKKSKWRKKFDGVIVCAIVVVWTKKCVLKHSFIFNHLTSYFPQCFFDIFLIRIFERKNENGRNFLMTSLQNYTVTSWQGAIWKKFNPNWSYITFRKSQKISGQTSKWFSIYATMYTAAPVWVGLNGCNKYKPTTYLLSFLRM